MWRSSLRYVRLHSPNKQEEEEGRSGCLEEAGTSFAHSWGGFSESVLIASNAPTTRTHLPFCGANPHTAVLLRHAHTCLLAEHTHTLPLAQRASSSHPNARTHALPACPRAVTAASDVADASAHTRTLSIFLSLSLSLALCMSVVVFLWNSRSVVVRVA